MYHHLHGGGVSETASLLCTLDETLDNYSTDSAVSRLNQSGTLSGEEDVSRLVQETAALQRDYGDSVDLTVGQLTRLWGLPQIRPTSRPGRSWQKFCPPFPRNTCPSGRTAQLL